VLGAKRRHTEAFLLSPYTCSTKNFSPPLSKMT
jgi:hypothetical protein